MSISKTIKATLLLQRMISLCVFCFLYSGYWLFLFIIRRYSILAIQDIRKQFNSITKNNSDPLLICSNHLTYIDSVLLTLAFSSCKGYLINFHTMAWNFPKTTHMKKNFFYKFISYIGKCIFIELDASSENMNQPMKIAKYLLSKGEYIMLFPEGHRGKNGKVDTQNFTYGVGKLIYEIPNIKVLCVYLRGSSQKYSSNFPNKYDNFYCKLKLIDPTELNKQISNNHSNLRNIRNISKDVIEILSAMEQEYFSATDHHQNHSQQSIARSSI